MKYAPAAANNPSTKHSNTSVISLWGLKVSASPVAKTGKNATAEGKNRFMEIFLISFRIHRTAPTEITTAI